MKTKRIVFSIVLVILTVSVANSSDRNSIRSLGMGRVGVTTVRGIDAISINPANFGMNGIGTFNLSLVPLNARVSTELISYDIYQKYFTGVDTGGDERARYYLTEEDKNSIRDQLPENGLTKVGADVMYGGLSFELGKMGGFGFGIIDHVGLDIALSRDFFDLLYLEGLPSNATYSFSGSSADAYWYREYNFSYGMKIPAKIPFVKALYGGVGFKVVHGFGVYETVENNSYLTNNNYMSEDEINTLYGKFYFKGRGAGIDLFKEIDNDDDDDDEENKDSNDVKFKPFPEPAGTGIGLDFGATAELANGITVGLSVVDIGKISWKKNLIETRGDGDVTIQGYEKHLEDTVKNRMKGQSYEGEPFSTSLPTVLRIGASINSKQVPFLAAIPGNMLLAFEYAQGLNKSLGNTTKPRFSLGMEYRIIPGLPIRTGLVLGGGDALRWAFGTALDFRFFAIELATDNFGMVFMPKSLNAVSVSTGIKIRI
ncbi:MAG: hypothetical protein KBG83_02910 [Bacteroidetes bacterium]|nr:hypothetical protein [Bacteroidota bacterium]